MAAGYSLKALAELSVSVDSDQNQGTVWVCGTDNHWNKNIATEVLALPKLKYELAEPCSKPQ